MVRVMLISCLDTGMLGWHLCLWIAPTWLIQHAVRTEGVQPSSKVIGLDKLAGLYIQVLNLVKSSLHCATVLLAQV